MDSQFNSLIQSYSNNYIQYKVTGNTNYQNAYTSAQQGLESIISQLQNAVNEQKGQISAFYKSGVEQKLTDLEQRNRFLQRGIVSEKDEITSAEMRAQAPPPTSIPTVQTWQYIALGVLGATAIGLSVM